jgi:hypothetical protein
MWADGGVGTGEHPPSEVRFEDDNVPPIPLRNLAHHRTKDTME